MLTLHDISLCFGTQEIFRTISCSLQLDQRIALVGRNGTGKSTLLKIIAGLVTPDTGRVALQKNTKVAYMPQEQILQSDQTVFDEAFSIFNEYTGLEAEKEKLEQLFNTSQATQKQLEQYTSIVERLVQFDRVKAVEKTQNILAGLGFSQQSWRELVAQLSVGWKMRLVLVKLLLQEADFYLLDEPTNHLDIVAKQWFFEFLRRARFGFLLVTHDKYFLEQLCTQILEIEHATLTCYTGNFTEYRVQKERQLENTQRAYERQQREIARKQQTIERFRASASKATLAQSMIKQLDKLERIELQSVLPQVSFSFAPVIRSGAVVLTLNNITYSFDDTKTLLTNVNAVVQRSERVALVAPNGAGKSTFFSLITGKYKPQQGVITFGHNVEYAYFEQDQVQALRQEATVWQEISNACSDTPETLLRNFLGAFLFSADTIYKKIKVLSGGERNRVALVKLLAKKSNFLLLDEPTNHLDIYTKELLIQALEQYQGTLLFVSHDHDFLNRLATRIIELNTTGLVEYHGNYQAYIDQKIAHAGTAPQIHKIQQVHKLQNGQHTNQVINKQIAQLEYKIGRAEKEQEKINALFYTHAYGTPEYSKAVTKLQDNQKLLEDLYNQWETLQRSILS